MRFWPQLRRLGDVPAASVTGGAASLEAPPMPPALGTAFAPAVAAHAGAANLADVPEMKSSDLRRLAEAAASEGADPALWAALSQRCAAHADHMNYWDAVAVLQAFTKANVKNEPLFMRVGEALSTKTSKFAPKHVLDVFAVFEENGIRPRALYVELFHAVIRLSRSMYAEELSLTLQALARYGIGNPTVLAHVVRTMQQQLREFRLRYLCGAAGALGAMQACPPALLELLDSQAKLEVETVPMQELLENMQAFPLLEYSWLPYEKLNLDELVARTKSFQSAADMDQFADPFEALRFFQARGLLHEEFLKSLCQWCLVGVHRPNVRSERRPTTRQLIALYDHCQELGMGDLDALQDALQYFVESAGGHWQPIMPQPLAYRQRSRKHPMGRRYVRTDDPMEGMQATLPAAEAMAVRVPRASKEEGLPGLPGLPSDDASAVEEASEVLVPLRRRKKPSASSTELAPEDSTVMAWSKSRKGPRPRRRELGLAKITRKDWVTAPLWIRGGWEMRPKYQQGVATKKYPHAGVPIGNLGAAWAMRR